MAEAPAKQSYSTDPALYIYTSLTAGSSHIVTATSRLETILKANRVPFKAIDIATDEKARMLWGRRAGKDEGNRLRKLPGLVQMGMVLGDLVEIEEWNEYGELKQHVTIYYDEHTIPPKGAAQPANLMKPIYNKPPARPAASASASTTPKAIPAAPPLPGKSDINTKAANDTKKSTVASGTAATAAAAAVVAPVKSIAAEAAEKAKKVRLESLRAKVQKDKDDASHKESGDKQSKEPVDSEKKARTEATPAPLALKKETSVDSTAAASSTSVPPTPRSGKGEAAGAVGLQSPTSGAWKTTSNDEHLRNVLQSPTSGTWKPGDSSLALPIREHRGSVVEPASPEEIAAVEKAEAIPEASSEEGSSEEDEEDDDEEEASESEEEKKAKK